MKPCPGEAAQRNPTVRRAYTLVNADIAASAEQEAPARYVLPANHG